MSKAATPQRKRPSATGKRPGAANPERKAEGKTVTTRRAASSEEYDLPIFRKRFAEALEARGIGQRRFAAMMGRSPSQINLTIVAKHKPDLRMLEAIGNHLDVSIDWMLGLPKKPTLTESRHSATMAFRLNDNEASTLLLPKDWVENTTGVVPQDLKLETVDSDDMAPTLVKGDLIFTHKIGFTKKSGLFKIHADEMDIIRRIRYNPVDSKTQVFADSEPNNIAVMDVKKLNVIGPVTKIGHKFYSL